MSNLLLVQEIKGSSFRLLDIAENKYYRAMKADFNLCVGSLLTVDSLEVYGDLIESMSIAGEVVGDSEKARIEVDTAIVKIGDLIEGVPVLNLGKSYAKAGKKMAYAYFK